MTRSVMAAVLLLGLGWASTSKADYYRGGATGATAATARVAKGSEFKCSWNRQENRSVPRGLSVFDAVAKLPHALQAAPFHVGSLPHGLEFLTIGRPGHAEIVPTAAPCAKIGTWMKLDEYQRLLGQVTFTAVHAHGR